MTFEMEQKPAIEFPGIVALAHGTRKRTSMWGESIRLKGCRHLLDFAIINSLSIFCGKKLLNWGVFSVILDGQKWELALCLALLFFFYSPSEGWHFMGLPSLCLPLSHLFPSLCYSPPEPWSSLLLNWTDLSMHKADWVERDLKYVCKVLIFTGHSTCSFHRPVGNPNTSLLGTPARLLWLPEGNMEEM